MGNCKEIQLTSSICHRKAGPPGRGELGAESETAGRRAEAARSLPEGIASRRIES
jgi:hypothetical protein